MHRPPPQIPRPIRRLTDTLVNQIAAGEVIERPANAVKELVENAIDAGATQIVVSLDEAGRDRIEVRDNGHGIDENDLPLAFERHCTSKLERFEDLLALQSLGFRGEALASLAAVADLTLTTRTAAARAATMARLVGDELRLEPAAHPTGTTVRVTDLFGRVPARRAFMKPASAELVQVELLFRQIAFATPAVRFELHNNGRRLRVIPAGDALGRQRLSALFGSRFAAAALPVAGRGDIRIEGLVSAPDAARNRADLQVLVVNGRPIRDRQLHHAVRAVFADTLPAGLHPAYALSIAIAPETLDVNVHPAKLEVRFAHLREVHDQLYAALAEALGATLGKASGQAGSHAVTGGHEFQRPLSVGAAGESRVASGGESAGAPSTSGRRPLPLHGRRPGAVGGQPTGPLPVLIGGRFRLLPRTDGLTLVDLEQVIAIRVAAACSSSPASADTDTDTDTRTSWPRPVGAPPLVAGVSETPDAPATRPLLLPMPLAPAPLPTVADALRTFGFVLDTRVDGLWLTAVPRWLPPVDGGVLARELATGDGCPDAVAAAVVAAWTREITPLLDRWAESTPEAVRELDVATIARLWSSL